MTQLRRSELRVHLNTRPDVRGEHVGNMSPNVIISCNRWKERAYYKHALSPALIINYDKHQKYLKPTTKE